MKVIFINIVLFYAIFAVFALFVSDRMIFLPPRADYKDTPDFLKLTTSDGETIYAAYLPNEKAKYTLLVSHGNAEDIGRILPFLQEIHDRGFAVFAYDYHGYGLSSGKPTENNTYLDINAAYDYLTKNLNVAPKDIIIYGHSLGAAVALDLAVRKPVAAVILQGAFITAFRVMTYIPLLPFDKFDNLKKITQLKCPLLMIHGISDGIIPFWHGRKLYKEAYEPKQFYQVKGAGHNDVLSVAGEEYWQTLKDFVLQVERSQK
jgi:fermentation-respiration switch protein FrsA (DUF1100 family)